MKESVIKVVCRDQSCPLAKQRDCVPAQIIQERDDGRIDILFVGEAPAHNEVDQSCPFVGVSGTLFRRVFSSVKQDRQYNYGISNAIRCWPRDTETRKPTEDEVRRCRHFLHRDIDLLDPQVLVLMGGTAVESVLGNKGTISDERGRAQEIEIAGKKRLVFSTWHPSFINRNKNLLPVFFDDIRVALRLADGWRPEPHWSRPGKSRLLKTVPEIDQYIQFLRRGLDSSAMVSVDVETKNLNKVWGNKLGMIQFAHDEYEATCIPLDHPQTPLDPQEVETVKALLRKLFLGKVSFKYWLAHGGLFEQVQIGHHILQNGNQGHRTIRNVPMIDTMGFAYLLNENKVNVGEEGFGLKHLARQCLWFNHYDDVTLSARSEGALLDLPIESPVPWGGSGWVPNLTDYGGMDAYVTYRLFNALKIDALEQRYFKKAMALLEFLFSGVFRLISMIERNGFWADLDHLRMLQDPTKSPILRRLKEIDNQEIKKFETAVQTNTTLALKKSGGARSMFGDPWLLDLNKPDHVRQWLVEQCGLEPLVKTKTDKASVGKAFFARYENVPEVALVKERRGLAKLATSYINQIIEYLDPRKGKEDCQDGRIRSNIHFTSTVTGRASSSDPNMQQQVKADSPEKAAIKSIFKAEQPGVQSSYRINFSKGPPASPSALSRPTNALVQLDFRTNEVVWWALSAQCQDLAKALNNGKVLRDAYRQNPEDKDLKKKAKIEGDLHRQTASSMYGIPIYDVQDEQRQASKSIQFGWMFGRGNKAIASQIKKSVEETSKLIQMFGDRFPLGRDYLHGLPDVARNQGFVDSLIGRRRHLPGYALWDKDLFDWNRNRENPDRERDDLRSYLAECDRQAKNSGIQGIASDAAFIGAVLFSDYIENQGRDQWLIQNVVHDSCVYQVPISDLKESIQVAERCFTDGVMDYMTQHWGVNFICKIEVEFEIGLTWGNLIKWDCTEPDLDRIIQGLSAVKDQDHAKEKETKSPSTRPADSIQAQGPG